MSIIGVSIIRASSIGSDYYKGYYNKGVNNRLCVHMAMSIIGLSIIRGGYYIRC